MGVSISEHPRREQGAQGRNGGYVYCCDVLSTKQAGKEQVVQQTCRRKMRSLPCAVFE